MAGRSTRLVAGALILASLVLPESSVARRHPRPLPSWAEIASFYAGRPVTIGVDDRGPSGATTGLPESGKILLGSGIRKNLDDWRAQWIASEGHPNKRRHLAALFASSVPVLLHEAMHNRHFTDGYFDESNPNTGFRNAGNENQAIALGSELVPDLLKRFFGYGIDTRLSRAYARAAKGRSEYTGAYAAPIQRPF